MAVLRLGRVRQAADGQEVARRNRRRRRGKDARRCHVPAVTARNEPPPQRMLVPAERFELPTNGLQNRCSTTELCRPRCGAPDARRVPARMIVAALGGQAKKARPRHACVPGPWHEKPGSDLLWHGKCHTTIGAERFHFRVRNGIGWFPLAIAARQTGKFFQSTPCRVRERDGSLHPHRSASHSWRTARPLEVIWSSLTGN
jgi:hypothetical protein